MSDLKTERARLLAIPCGCTPCVYCQGAGRFYVSGDDGEFVTCVMCDRGISEVCERCRMLAEIQRKAESA